MQPSTSNQEKSNIAEPTEYLNCFVSSPVGTDLSSLLSIIEENNIHVLNPNEFAPGAVQITEKLIDGIERADLIVGVLGSRNSDANVMYELGYATALEKRILIIADDESEIPSDIQGLVRIKSSLDNKEAIEFALQQIIYAPIPEKKARKVLPAKTKPLKQKSDLFLEELSKLSLACSERKVEDLVREILAASGVTIISEQKYKDIRPDFAVWIDELEPYFGNPILIEVKGSLDPSKAKYALEQSLHYMSLSKVRAVLIFSQNLPLEVIQEIPKSPFVYFFDLHQLIQSLREQSLGEIIRNRRNSIVHGRIE